MKRRKLKKSERIPGMLHLSFGNYWEEEVVTAARVYSAQRANALICVTDFLRYQYKYDPTSNDAKIVAKALDRGVVPRLRHASPGQHAALPQYPTVETVREAAMLPFMQPAEPPVDLPIDMSAVDELRKQIEAWERAAGCTSPDELAIVLSDSDKELERSRSTIKRLRAEKTLEPLDPWRVLKTACGLLDSLYRESQDSKRPDLELMLLSAAAATGCVLRRHDKEDAIETYLVSSLLMH